MKAGFGKVQITPSIGTRMFGWGQRDADHGCEGVHDDLFVRALWLEDAGEEALVVGFDLLFFSRDIADRLRGALGRRFGLAPRQILLNTSHTHNGPATGTWSFAQFSGVDPIYIDNVELATIHAASQARESVRPVSVSAGETSIDIAVNRRKLNADGNALWEPNPDGPVYDKLPICLFKDSDDRPVCLLFSVSCHPSTVNGFLISADYPGAAMMNLDTYLGAECSLFLQGMAGETKVKSFSQNTAFGTTWEDVEEAGKRVAETAIRVIADGLEPVETSLHCSEVIADLVMTALPDRTRFESLADSADAEELVRMWARRKLEVIDRGGTIPTSVPVTVHGVRVGQNLRIIGLEGELVAEHGQLIRRFYGSGITFPLGYTDGCQLYVPTSSMLAEGGYEVNSYYEYGWPAPLAPGIEDSVVGALRRLGISTI